MTEFTTAEQNILDETVRRRTTHFKRPVWMQAHRARAISAEAARLIADSPPPPSEKLRSADRVYYNAPARVRATGRRSSTYKIHEDGGDGRPICTMGQNPEWKAEHLGAGAVTCGKCAATRSR